MKKAIDFPQNLDTLQFEFSRAAIENLHEGVVFQDAEYKILSFNSAALETLGLTAEQLTGKSSLDPDWWTIKEDGSRFSGEEHPAVVCMKTGQKQHNVLMGVNQPSSDLRWIQINSTPLFLEGKDKPSHSVTSFTDITQLIEDRKLIERQKQELKRVFDGVPSMIGHWSRDLINLNANTAYQNFFGKSPEQILGQPMKSVIGDDLFKKNYPYIQGVLNGTTQIFERDITLPDGNLRHTLSTYLPELDGNEVIGFFVVVNDVTSLKNLENERQEMAVKMLNSSKLSALGEMAGGVAHEINTPLTAIQIRTTLLLDGLKLGPHRPEHLQTELEKIRNTTDKIAKIVKGLRLFSRNSEADPMENVLVAEIVESTMDLCREKIKNSNIEIRMNITPDLSIFGRATEIAQVLLNLISNAADAAETSPTDKWIEIKSQKLGEVVRISVTDCGNGIAATVVEKMMNPFFTTKPPGKGTGLGLCVSKSIIENHNGRLFYDQTSANTRFVIELTASIESRKNEGAA